jgi:hypothetical protein
MLTQVHKVLINHANQTGKMSATSAAKIIGEDENSFWEFFANNNPAGIIGIYKANGNTKMPTNPHVQNVYPILKNLLMQKNYKELGFLIANTPYLPNVNNITTSAAVWQQLGVTPGDYVSLFQKYYPNQFALTTISV